MPSPGQALTCEHAQGTEAPGPSPSARTAVADTASRRLFAVTAQGARSLAQTRVTRDRLWTGVNLQALLNG